MVKLGIDKRESVLTWENFQNSWGTTKEQDAGKRNEKGKGKRWQEEEAEEIPHESSYPLPISASRSPARVSSWVKIGS